MQQKYRKNISTMSQITHPISPSFVLITYNIFAHRFLPDVPCSFQVSYQVNDFGLSSDDQSC